MPGIHAKLSASGSAKWLNCPGSIALESEIPNESSSYAEEGTTAHALGELKINLALSNITRNKYSRDVKKLGDIPPEMEEYMEGYKDFVIENYNKALANSSSAVIAVELRLDFSDYVPDGFGTGDVVIVSGNALCIIDLKYGKGVKVNAEENPQLRLYGLGAYFEYDYLYDIDTVTYMIYQPRLDNVSVFSEDVSELLKWGEEIVKPHAVIALSEDAPCVAGEYCDNHFCRARPICRAYNEKRLELAKYDFIKPNRLSNDEISEILEIMPKISKWCEVVQAYVTDRVLAGEKFSGYKLVEGRSNRKYSDEKAITDVLLRSGYDLDDITVRKLYGITEMQKLLGADTFNELLKDYIIKPQGKPTLVPETDKRPEIGSSASAISDFEDN